MRLRVGLMCALLLVAGCSRAKSADPPPVLDRYLTAVKAGNYSSAYRMTTLPQQSSGQPGFALTEDHYAAFYRAHPLQSYDVKKVTKLSQDVLDENGRRLTTGTFRFVVDMSLRYADGTRNESWEIEGDVVGVIDIGAAAIPLRTRAVVKTITVDGVPTPVSAGGSGRARSYYLTVMNGSHVVRVGSTTVELLTEPLTVRSGSARVEDGVVVLA